jgi:hypothetical protein
MRPPNRFGTSKSARLLPHGQNPSSTGVLMIDFAIQGLREDVFIGMHNHHHLHASERGFPADDLAPVRLRISCSNRSQG